ncbi:CBS domain-containing protein [Roseateles sp. DB2]|uniref:CBS domain-containing protein n=1 Tax=Roseateles sp. DB2 TaxID=3453717 RepID=UPI003EECE45F
MARDVVCVGAAAPLDAAWGLLARHKVKALPVVGMITQSDVVAALFMRPPEQALPA